MYLWSLLHGHATSRCADGERRADRMHARHERAVGAEHVEHRAPHARHDPHVDDDVRAVGDLDADVRDGAAERPHRERHHVHRAAAHAAVEESVQRARASPPARPSCWSGPRRRALAADERAVLDARDVGRVGAREVAVGTLRVVQPSHRAGRDHLGAQPVVFGLRCRRTRRCGRAASAPRSRAPSPAAADGAHRPARRPRRRAWRRIRLVHREWGTVASKDREAAACERAALCAQVPHPPAHPLSWPQR